jgi:hypothetical protein
MNSITNPTEHIFNFQNNIRIQRYNISRHHLQIQKCLLTPFQICIGHPPASCHPVKVPLTIKTNRINLMVKGPTFALTENLTGDKQTYIQTQSTYIQV